MTGAAGQQGHVGHLLAFGVPSLAIVGSVAVAELRHRLAGRPDTQWLAGRRVTQRLAVRRVIRLLAGTAVIAAMVAWSVHHPCPAHSAATSASPDTVALSSGDPTDFRGPDQHRA